MAQPSVDIELDIMLGCTAATAGGSDAMEMQPSDTQSTSVLSHPNPPSLFEKHVPDSSLEAAGSHGSQDPHPSVYTGAKERSPESVDSNEWNDAYGYGQIEDMTGYDDYKDQPVSSDGSNEPDFGALTPDLNLFASNVQPSIQDTTEMIFETHHGLRPRPDYLQMFGVSVADDDPTGDFVVSAARQAPRKKRKSTKRISQEDLDEDVEADTTPPLTAEVGETIDRDREDDKKFEPCSTPEYREVTQPRTIIRNYHDRAANTDTESDADTPRQRSRKEKRREKKKAKKFEKSRKATAKSKKRSRKRQPSPSPSIVSDDSSNRSISRSIRSVTPPRRTIITRLCHPIAFNHKTTTIPCSVCSPKYALLGLGPRTVTVHDAGHNKGPEETVTPEHPTTKICLPCTADRMRMLICRDHILQPIENTAVQSTRFEDAFQRVLDGVKPLETDLWCSVCPSPALYRCVGSRVMEEAGCGLLICGLCFEGLQRRYRGVLEEFLEEVGDGEGDDGRPLGIRADAELLRMRGPLGGFMIRMAGGDWDE